MIGRRLYQGAIELLYPARCLICGQPGRGGDAHFCAMCDGGLRDGALRCPQCATTVGPHSLREDTCAACRREAPPFARAFCLGSYRGSLKVAVLRMKNASGEGIAELLGRRWAKTHALGEPPIDAIVPLPLHWWKQWRRGYNQSAAVARGIATSHRLPIRPRWLRCIRRTAPQKSLNSTARRINVQGAFRASPFVSGRHILLIDDVMTTGATAEEAARALRRAGAGRVTVAILARVTAEEPESADI
jgi:ComF family protein